MRTVNPHPIELFTSEELLKELSKRCTGFVFVGQWDAGRMSLSGSVGLSIRTKCPLKARSAKLLRSGVYQAIKHIHPAFPEDPKGNDDGQENPSPRR